MLAGRSTAGVFDWHGPAVQHVHARLAWLYSRDTHRAHTLPIVIGPNLAKWNALVIAKQAAGGHRPPAVIEGDVNVCSTSHAVPSTGEASEYH
jgi:hypothetical protein